MKPEATAAVDWNQLWKTPATQMAMGGPSFRHKLRWVRRAFTRYASGSALLDVACGQGALLHALNESGFNRTGIDCSQTALEQAREQNTNVQFLQHDIESGALESKFDVITCTNALEEMRNDTAALRNMSLMLNPGGYLILVVPHRRDFWSRLDEGAGNQRRYERAELADKLQAAGLKPVELTTWGFPLYALWNRTVKVVDQDRLLEKKQARWVAILASKLVYLSLFIDDIFVGAHRGRILFAVAEKQS